MGTFLRGIYCTAHGIPGISRAQNKYVRLMWIVCFLSSVSYCCYAIVSIVMSYFSFGVLINMQVIDSPNIDFPAVTVCNLNPLDNIYAQWYIDKVLAANNISYVENVCKIFII